MQAAPNLSSPGVSAAGTETRRPGRRPMAILLALLLVVGVAAGLAWTQRDLIEQRWSSWAGGSAEATEQISAAEDASVPTEDNAGRGQGERDRDRLRDRLDTPRERVVTDPDAAQNEVERMVAAQRADEATEEASQVATAPRRGQSVSRPAPKRNRTSAASAEQVAEIERRLAEAQRRRELAEARAQDENEAVKDPEISPPGENDGTEAWTPEATEYVRSWELPLSIRRALPALNLSIHVFSDQAEERFVLINGVRYISGDDLPEGARLVDIRREGAIVDYRDYRFLLEP